MRTLALLTALALTSACSKGGDDTSTTGDDTDTSSGDDTDVADPNRVTMVTSMGTMVFELDPDHAPNTTANFLQYVDEGFYDGRDGLGATTIHRVSPGFVIQGGGYTQDGTPKTTHAPIDLEMPNGLSNLQYTVAMARTNDPNSATSQWFVNLVDNTTLDDYAGGYAVFGEVVEGTDVVDAIGAVPVNGDAPKTPIVITSCTREAE